MLCTGNHRKHPNRMHLLSSQFLLLIYLMIIQDVPLGRDDSYDMAYLLSQNENPHITADKFASMWLFLVLILIGMNW